VLIMDEPTAALTKKDTDTLFQIVRRLKARGVGVIYISHRLEEVFQLADRVTVLRDSHLVHTGLVAEVDQQALIRYMVGRTLDTLYPKEAAPIGDVLLETKNLRRSGVLHDISLTVRQGEIVCLAGLVGSGRSEVAQAIFGIDPIDGGQVMLKGRPVHITGPQLAIALGLAYVPEDRQHQALVLPMAVSENMTLAVLRSLCRWGFIQRPEEEALAWRYVDQLSIRTPGVRNPVGSLSGGNQQKVVLAKWLASTPQVLILDEPTRGVDVGAKAEIHRLMSELAKQGLGMLMISSELPEVLGMADRVLVMYRGRLAGELSRPEATQERIITLATGATA
ncbi:MAG: sugar ABC transporter ATP-binding protein, partial [Deinococcus sp.]|nr:sugar ABC transporter ATP-binding protein [Deinococcus sp.]